ncbi:hypothetical protein FN976_25615 [Caenimonas sedimenti]|uniref:Virulence-associated protein E-like domain-containing protein n=1 Tax=Caenimonas sedimenti TaxID=2596921 RepID=A0A562ZHG6_9BURK|nr:VapE domain-containing protein [Caenimonas sedimenti]TWO67766.1 hypothetical protein FN976_25615 [Caenimonas sedimenti]
MGAIERLGSMGTRHAEAKRLLSKGFRLCALHPMSKRPVGEDWQHSPVSHIDEDAGGYGMLLAANGLCSIDPDNQELARVGLLRCGFDLEAILDAGVRTVSTRPGSGGRSTFRAGSRPLKWITFRSKRDGVALELRATSINLQDTLPGTIYMTPDGGPYEQRYASERRLDVAPSLPDEFEAWWSHLSTDLAFLHEQQRLFSGAGVEISVSGGDGNLAFPSTYRVEFNSNHLVPVLLERNGYTQGRNGRWAPPRATGTAGVRPIPHRDGLWQSDHASDPLHGTFDAWSAFVVLEHGGNVNAAEVAWSQKRDAALAEGFVDVTPLEPAERALPPFRRNLKTGEVLTRRGNIVLALGRPDLSGFRVRFDEFRGEIMIATHGQENWRPFQDTDYTAICLRLEQQFFRNIGRELIRETVAFVAGVDRFDSAGQWLAGLSWDGVPRVESFFTRCFGTADTSYTRAVAKYMWSAMAGRVLVPGVKCDMVPVLVGEQGMRKSSAVAALVPSSEYFTTVDLSRKDEELARLMRGKLVIELDELKGLSTREAEHIKAFITRRHEEWTPKYMEMNVRYDRRCIFVGTSNRDDFLADDTGNRRWLPLHCGMCDPNTVVLQREQLWAEARDLFKTHGVMHAEAERLARPEHGKFVEHDEWDIVVAEWLNNLDYTTGLPYRSRPYLTSKEVLSGALSIAVAQQSKANQMRVRRVLMRLGYQPANKYVNGIRTRMYIAPAVPLLLPAGSAAGGTTEHVENDAENLF